MASGGFAPGRTLARQIRRGQAILDGGDRANRSGTGGCAFGCGGRALAPAAGRYGSFALIA